MAVNFSGRWINQHNSVMDLAVNGNMISGTYTTAVPGQLQGPLTGFVTFEDEIGFCVHWRWEEDQNGDGQLEHHESICTWSGQVATHSGVDVIHTFWHLTNEVADAAEPDHLYAGMYTGGDYFVREGTPFPPINEVLGSERPSGPRSPRA